MCEITHDKVITRAEGERGAGLIKLAQNYLASVQQHISEYPLCATGWGDLYSLILIFTIALPGS